MSATASRAELLPRVSGKIIYGTIVVAAVVGSLSDPLPSNLTVMLTVFLSLLGISIANAYAASINEDMATGSVTPWRDRWKSLLDPSWVMIATVVPIACFGLAALGLISQMAALILTKVFLLVLLLLFGFVSRRCCQASVVPSLLAGIAVALLGYGVVQLKMWCKYLPEVGF